MVSIALSRLWLLVGICLQGNQAKNIEEAAQIPVEAEASINCQMHFKKWNKYP
jgi:hypothetical protein